MTGPALRRQRCNQVLHELASFLGRALRRETPRKNVERRLALRHTCRTSRPKGAAATGRPPHPLLPSVSPQPAAASPLRSLLACLHGLDFRMGTIFVV